MRRARVAGRVAAVLALVGHLEVLRAGRHAGEPGVPVGRQRGHRRAARVRRRGRAELAALHRPGRRALAAGDLHHLVVDPDVVACRTAGKPAAEATVIVVCAAVVAVGRVVVFGFTW